MGRCGLVRKTPRPLQLDQPGPLTKPWPSPGHSPRGCTCGGWGMNETKRLKARFTDNGDGGNYTVQCDGEIRSPHDTILTGLPTQVRMPNSCLPVAFVGRTWLTTSACLPWLPPLLIHLTLFLRASPDMGFNFVEPLTTSLTRKVQEKHRGKTVCKSYTTQNPSFSFPRNFQFNHCGMPGTEKFAKISDEPFFRLLGVCVECIRRTESPRFVGCSQHGERREKEGSIAPLQQSISNHHQQKPKSTNSTQ
jgi:hypothetical protein